MDLLGHVRDAIDQQGLLAGGEGVVVAVSGGADSVALLHVLHLLSPDLRLRLHVAHLHHGLRRGADEDAVFVERVSNNFGLPCTVARVDAAALARTGRRSPEDAGRQARYEFFSRVAATAGAAAIAVAHTQDDQIETVLMRLQQGAPWELLAGMRPRRPGPGVAVIRPLLAAARVEIRQFLRDRGLVWREDPTNLDLSIPRNRVRHADLPALTAAHPAWPQALGRLGEAARLSADLLDRLADRLYGHLGSKGDSGVVMALEDVRALPEPLRGRVIRRAVAEVVGTSHPLSRVLEGRMVRALTVGRPGTEVADEQVGLRIGYGEVEIGPPSGAPTDTEYRLAVPGEARAESFGRIFMASIEPRREPSDDAGEAILDAACIESPLRIRAWRPGDVFRPLGLPGKKKVQDFFVDAKVPRWQRRRIPLVVDARGEIVWVVGHRIADPCRVRAETTQVLRLRVRSA